MIGIHSSAMIDLQKLSELVDGTQDHVTPIQDNLPALYSYVGLNSQNAWSRDAVTDAFMARIKCALGILGEAVVERHVRLLLDEIILRNVLDDAPRQPYARLLEIIRDAMRNHDTTGTSAPSPDWSVAVQAAADYSALSEGTSDEMLPRFHSRQFAVARAARWLRDHGYTVLVQSNRVSLGPASEARLTSRLSNLVREIGGIRVVGQIWICVGEYYDQEQQRYHLVRRVSTVVGKTSPAVPWGYLIQLAAKYPITPPTPLYAAQNWHDLIELSTQYATMHDVQPYSTWESLFKDTHTLVRWLQELAVFDSFFTLHQIKPAHAIAIVRGVLTSEQRQQVIADVATLDEVIIVAETLLNMGLAAQMPICFHWRDVAQFCAVIPPQKVAAILEKVLSHPPPAANQGYVSPTDDTLPDFTHRPCLPLHPENYCLLLPALCARGAIEAVFTPLRQADRQFDGNLGFAIEAFLRREFKSRCIATQSGKYPHQNKTMECDIVVETEDTIMLLEVKKKPLTRKANTGSDIAVLLDLAGSLLEAQLQAGNHELLLRQQGYLELHENGVTTRLEHRNRQIERIAITLFDYGSFQDRMMLEQFLRIGSNLQFRPVDPIHLKKFNELNENILQLRQQVSELEPLIVSTQQKPFFHCWFLSVPQILQIIERCQCADDFKNELWRTRHISTGSLDFYFDYSWVRRLSPESGDDVNSD